MQVNIFEGENIIAMFTFHISHVISKSGRFSKKGVAHAIIVL